MKDNYKIKIEKNGPYIVSGGVPLGEKIITPKGREYEYVKGRALPQKETYALCRCGKTKTPPFCDGEHHAAGFIGQEKASRRPYHDRADTVSGFGIDLLDDYRCAFARFCHRKDSNVWDLTHKSKTAENCAEVIQGANDCPTGRLTAVDKDGKSHEPCYEPAIDLLQDPEQGVSSGLFVQGGIPIESADGTLYETRNRVVLCRCGKSKDTPFCDASHVREKYRDQE